MEQVDAEVIGDELAEGRPGVSLWKTKQQMDAAKELEEDRQLFRDTKKKHTESHIEKQRRIDALKEEKDEWAYEPLENEDFSINGSKAKGFRGKLDKLKLWFKKKGLEMKRKTEIKYMDCIHISPSLNAVFLTGAFTDKYSQVYEADREYVKAFNKTKLVNVFLPDGSRGKAVLNYDVFDENMNVPKWEANADVRALQDLEQSRDRLFIDDQTRVNIEMDDKQMRLLIVAMFISGALGFILSSLLFGWLIFSGMI